MCATNANGDTRDTSPNEESQPLPEVPPDDSQPRRFARELLVAPIRFYQRFLSPLKPATCRFTPSCSGYAAGAIRTHGIALGLLLGTWRILRCQPFSKEGPDPVPEAGEWRSAFRRRR